MGWIKFLVIFFLFNKLLVVCLCKFVVLKCVFDLIRRFMMFGWLFRVAICRGLLLSEFLTFILVLYFISIVVICRDGNL